MAQNWDTAEDTETAGYVTDDGLTLAQFLEFNEERKLQPAWRAQADKESDFFDGNQLDSEVIRKQQAIGMPPAIEPLMGPELDKLCGIEQRLRKDWRVIPNSDVEDDDIAEALNVKLNAAERHSKADKACSDAFRGQAGVGISIIEVGREYDPFKFPYRVNTVNRNDCWWDWKGTRDPDMHDHRWFIRRRWTDKNQAKIFFPDKSELIEHAATGWANFDNGSNDGGRSTDLYSGGGAIQFNGSGAPTMLQGDIPGTYALLSSAYATEQTRGLTIEEQEWRDLEKKRVCIYECWYRVWSRATVFKLPGGRVVEYDPENDMHNSAIASGVVKVQDAVITKVRVSMWLGPHKLCDEPSPYKHNRFPYVPFYNKREDRTGVPFGIGRGWMYLQECVNAVSAKLRWGISAVRTKRTEGAYAGTDEQLHHEAARLDADIVLDAKAMVNGGIFEIERDFELTDQQHKLMQDCRDAIKRTGGGLDEDKIEGQPEQIPNQHGTLFDNFRESRNEVGELLLSLIIEDMVGVETAVIVKGDVSNDDKTIILNQKEINPLTGKVKLNNDIENTLMKVVLEDVPSTPSYRSQQMQSFSEVVKSAPPEMQKILYPQMFSLMDVPGKDKVIAAIREAGKQPTPEQIQQNQDQAVQQALLKANVQHKAEQLALESKYKNAQIEKLNADTVLQLTTAQFEAFNTGATIATAPNIAPIGDAVLKASGYTPPNPAGVNPMIESVPQSAQSPQLEVPQNTHPNFPPRPMRPDVGAKLGIEGG